MTFRNIPNTGSMNLGYLCMIYTFLKTVLRNVISYTNRMLPVLGMFLNVISALTGQLGPNYDPLFYDVMIYIFGTMMFTVFLLSIIAYWLRVHGWGYKDNRERWVDELDRHFEREGIGLIPDNGKYW